MAIRTGPIHQSVFAIHTGLSLFLKIYTGKNNGFPFLDSFGYLK